MATLVDYKELKQRVKIHDVLGHYGLTDKLKRKGENLVGACPIHKGTNATQFHVSLTKNNFNCFGDCHGGGNVIDFVAKMEGIDIRAAALKLQEWFEEGEHVNGNQSGSAQATKEMPAHSRSQKLAKEKTEEIKGHVVDVDFVVSNRQSKFIAIDEQPDDDIVHLDGARKADRLAHQPLDACA
jgi:DNA primase